METLKYLCKPVDSKCGKNPEHCNIKKKMEELEWSGSNDHICSFHGETSLQLELVCLDTQKQWDEIGLRLRTSAFFTIMGGLLVIVMSVMGFLAFQQGKILDKMDSLKEVIYTINTEVRTHIAAEAVEEERTRSRSPLKVEEEIR